MGLSLLGRIVRILHRDQSIDLQQAIRQPVQFKNSIIPVAPRMHLLCINPRHHMGGIMTLDAFARDFRSIDKIELLKKLSVPSIDHIEAVALPLGLIDLLLIMAGPKIMAIVHLLIRQRNLPLHIPSGS